MDETWVVLLEAAGDHHSGAAGIREVYDLLEALNPGPWGAALHSPDRYALQVTAKGSSPGDALIDVLARWVDAVRRLGLPLWKVVRTEVLTPEELEEELRDAHASEAGRTPPSPDPVHDRDEVGHELLRQAFSDPLTGLVGRAAFSHRLDAALVGAADGGSAAVVCVDLDRFRAVNDRFGGVAGDEILITVAQRLAAVLRPGDALGRLGGVEFAALLEATTEEAAVAVATRMLEAVRRPMTIGDREFTCSASAGVAVSEAGDDAGTVVDKAEAALALAKAAGGDGQVLYRSDEAHPVRTRREFRTAALQDRLAHLLLTQRAAVAANDAQTLDQAAQVVLRQICAHVGCDIGHLWLSPEAYQPSAARWHAPDASAYRAFQEAVENLSVHRGVGLVGRVLTTARPVWISELAAEADFSPQAEAAAAGLQSAFAFPVVVGDEVVAVFQFFTRSRTEPTGSFLDVLAGIGIQLGRVVERQRALAAMRRSEEELRASEGPPAGSGGRSSVEE